MTRLSLKGEHFRSVAMIFLLVIVMGTSGCFGASYVVGGGHLRCPREQ